MCLAVPMRIIKIDGDTGTAQAGGGIEQQIGLQLVPGLRVDDYVIVHAGYAIQKMDAKYALEAQQLFDELRRQD